MSRPDFVYETIVAPIEDRMIRSIWRVTRNAQDAEDAMQDALVAIWTRRGRIGRHAAPRALVLRMCVDAACDVVRRRSRHRRRDHHDSEDPADRLVDGARSPWEELAQEELSREILAAVNRLCRSQTLAFTLRVLEELPYEQVAAAMNCSEATVRKHLERARGHLRIALSKHEPHRNTRT